MIIMAMTMIAEPHPPSISISVIVYEFCFFSIGLSTTVGRILDLRLIGEVLKKVDESGLLGTLREEEGREAEGWI